MAVTGDDRPVVAVRVERVVLGAHVDVTGETRVRVICLSRHRSAGVERQDPGQRTVRLRRQPRGVVIGDRIGEAAAVDQPVPLVVVGDVVLRLVPVGRGEHARLCAGTLDRLVLVRVDLRQKHEEVLVAHVGGCRLVVGVLHATDHRKRIGIGDVRRADDECAEQSHAHLRLRVGARLVDVGARVAGDEAVGDRGVGRRRLRQRRRRNATRRHRRWQLGLGGYAIGEHVLLAGEHDRERLPEGLLGRQQVRERHGDDVTFVHAQDRTGVLERAAVGLVAPHVGGVPVGQADVALGAVQGEVRRVRAAGAFVADRADLLGGRGLGRGPSGCGRGKGDRGRQRGDGGESLAGPLPTAGRRGELGVEVRCHGRAHWSWFGRVWGVTPVAWTRISVAWPPKSLFAKLSECW